MDNQDLARLVLARYPIWLEVTELVDGELHVTKPFRPHGGYHDWVADAADAGWEALDAYVEYNGELLWVGEILDGLGIAPLLRSEEALREYACQHARDPFQQWDGFCTECRTLYSRRYRMQSIGAGEWQCPYCGAIEYHPNMSNPARTTHEQRTKRMAELLWGLGLEEQAQEYTRR